MSGTAPLVASDFIVQRMNYAANPWRIVHVPTQRQVSIPRTIRNGEGRDVHFNGPACFPRKRDAIAWLHDELPSLLKQEAT